MTRDAPASVDAASSRPAAGASRATDTDQREAEVRRGDPAPRRRWWVVALISLFAVACVVMWTYALWGPRHDPPGTMDDPAFGLAAEEICAPSLAAIDALPLAPETPDAVARAEVIVQANALLATELDGLDELAASSTLSADDDRRVTEWLADYRTHLHDREAYAEVLPTDPGARYLETPKEERPISFVLAEFARKNAMASCAPPGDVG